MATFNYKSFLSAFTLLLSLIVFSFGLYQESTLNSINPPIPIIKDVLAPFFYNLRNPIFLAFLLFLVLYGIIHRSLPSISPIIYTLCITHYLISLKTMAYVGEINLTLMRGSIGIMVTGFVFAIVAQTLKFKDVKKITFYSLVLTLVIAVISIDLSYIFGVPRYQFQFGNPNFAGTGLVSIFCFYCTFQVSSGRVHKLFFSLLFFIVFGLVVMTGSRTAITGLGLLLLLRSWKRLSIWKVAFVVAIILSGILYIAFSTELWLGRDNRLDLWARAFLSPSYSILTGGNINDFKASVEGFFVTLPFTLGIAGLVLLLVFSTQFFGLLRQLFASRSTQTETAGILNCFIVLLWMSFFESIFFGVLTPPMVVFVFLSSWYRRGLRVV